MEIKKEKNDLSRLNSGSPQSGKYSRESNKDLKNHTKHKINTSSSDDNSFNTSKKNRNSKHDDQSSDSSSMQISGNSDISDVSITSSDVESEQNSERREKRPLQVSKLISADLSNEIIAPPEQPEDIAFIHGDPFGQKFTDTDAEPSISNPDQARQELLAELPKKTKKEIESGKKSSSCTLL